VRSAKQDNIAPEAAHHLEDRVRMRIFLRMAARRFRLKHAFRNEPAYSPPKSKY
jgi:hypothetical protein